MLEIDHINIRTAQLDRLVAFYEGVLGMTSGPRPAFPFPGAWLYLGAQPVVHLVGVETAPGAPREAENLRLEHVAFRGSDLADFRRRLTEAAVAHEEVPLPGGEILQLHFFDPDGNHIHVDFRT